MSNNYEKRYPSQQNSGRGEVTSPSVAMSPFCSFASIFPFFNAKKKESDQTSRSLRRICRCSLCFPFTHHEADYVVSFGVKDRKLQVCKWCEEDLSAFGMRINQTVALPKATRAVRVPFWFLGPLRSLMEAKA